MTLHTFRRHELPALRGETRYDEPLPPEGPLPLTVSLFDPATIQAAVVGYNPAR